MELYLIRHAQSWNNARPQVERIHDPCITELGHRQAKLLADAMKRWGLTHLVTSPFLRALETTSYIHASTGLTPKVQVDLHEQGGCMSGPTPAVMVGQPGMNHTEIESRFPGYEISEEIGPHGWWKRRPYESEELVRERASNLLERTRQEFGRTEARVAFVMHADFIRTFLHQLEWSDLGPPFNTSVTRIVLDPHTTAIKDYNCVDHLPTEAHSR